MDRGIACYPVPYTVLRLMRSKATSSPAANMPIPDFHGRHGMPHRRGTKKEPAVGDAHYTK